MTTLSFSPVSEHNTVYHPWTISLLFQWTTLYTTPAIFLSCFSAKYSKSPQSISFHFQYKKVYITPPYFSPVSVHNTLYHPRSISLLFQYTTLYTTPLNFSHVSVHNTVYHPRSISLLFQYTTLYISHALFLSSSSTQHCTSAQCGILCFLSIQLLEFCFLLFPVASIFCNEAASTVTTFLYTQGTCVPDLPSI